MCARKQEKGNLEGGHYMYQEDMEVLDYQSVFDAVNPNGIDMYELTT